MNFEVVLTLDGASVTQVRIPTGGTGPAVKAEAGGLSPPPRRWEALCWFAEIAC